MTEIVTRSTRERERVATAFALLAKEIGQESTYVSILCKEKVRLNFKNVQSSSEVQSTNDGN